MQLMLPARQTQSFLAEKGAKFPIEEYFRGGKWGKLGCHLRVCVENEEILLPRSSCM